MLATAVVNGNLGGFDLLPNGKPAITPQVHETRSTVRSNQSASCYSTPTRKLIVLSLLGAMGRTMADSSGRWTHKDQHPFLLQENLLGACLPHLD